MIIAMAKEFKLPAIYPERIFVELGGLMSLGPDGLDLGRDCARVVRKSSTVLARLISQSRNLPSTRLVST